MDEKKEIWLSADELQHMLQGSLLWAEVAPRLTAPPKTGTGIRQLGEPLNRAEMSPEQISNSIGNDSQLLHPLSPKREKQVYSNLNSLINAGDKSKHTRLEGIPVIVLLGGVGTLTFASWFYFVLFR